MEGEPQESGFVRKGGIGEADLPAAQVQIDAWRAAVDVGEVEDAARVVERQAPPVRHRQEILNARVGGVGGRLPRRIDAARRLHEILERHHRIAFADGFRHRIV